MRVPGQSGAWSPLAAAGAHPAGGPVSRLSVVAVVSSAAASDTLPRVLAPLPTDFPAAVIALHAGPAGTEGQQVDSLAGRVQLPVSLAGNESRLVPGTVLLVPSSRQPLVTVDGVLRLVDVYSVPPEHRPVEQAPSADLLLYTLAVAFGSRAVAVLLSGRGAPGAVGAQAVHAHGGFTLVRGRPVAEALGRATPAADLPPSPPLTLDAIAPTLLRICSGSRQALPRA